MSLAELFIILLVALIVLGPEQLPTVAYKLGQWLQSLRRLTDDTRRELDQHLQLEQLHQNELKARQADRVYDASRQDNNDN